MAKTKGRKTQPSNPVDWVRVRAVATPVMRVVSSLVVIYCLGHAAAHLAREGRQEARFLVNPGSIAGDDVPGMPESVRADLRRRLSEQDPISIFDPSFDDQIRAAIVAASPWIDDVTRVEKIYPNRARVDMIWRKPVAAIAMGGRRYLLDAQSRVLHEESEFQASTFPFVVFPIFGAQAQHVPALGKRFPDAEVENAVNVALEMRSLSPAYREAMDAARPVALYIRGMSGITGTHPGEVCIRSEAGAILRWGRPAVFRKEDGSTQEWGILEPSPEKKVTHLAQIMEAVPGLRGLAEARLDWDRPWYKETGGRVNASMESDWVDRPGTRGSGS